MNRGDPLAAVEAVLDGRARRHAPLAGFSSYKVGGPADLLVDQQPADGERVVTDHFGGQPKTRLAGVEPILRIAFPERRGLER